MPGPRYKGLNPASAAASAAARGSSRKRNNNPELALKMALRSAGYRFSQSTDGLPGKPDLAIKKVRVAVFCDGDFWHGKIWRERRRKLSVGTNAPYWVAKIEANMLRDRRSNERLRALGWVVLRFWESEILRDIDRVVRLISASVDSATLQCRASFGGSGHRIKSR